MNNRQPKIIRIGGREVHFYTTWMLPFFSSQSYVIDFTWLHRFLQRGYATQIMAEIPFINIDVKIRMILSSGDRLFVRMRLAEYNKLLNFIEDNHIKLNWNEWGF